METNTEQPSVRVRRCADCPFFVEDDYEPYCSADRHLDASFDFTRLRGLLSEIPSWCPLRDGGINITLVLP